MGLVVLASAKGSPGVTTLAVTMAALGGPGAILADLDPGGGDVALRYRNPAGDPLDPDVGLLSLAAAIRGRPAEQSPAQQAGPPEAPLVGDHLQTISGGLPVLVGVGAPEQVTGLGPLWPQLGRALRGVPDAEVFADCGRVGVGSPTLPVLLAADAVLLVSAADLEQLAHLRARLRFLREVLRGGRGQVALGVVLVAPERDRGVAAETARLLAASGLPVPVVGTVADDPKGARLLRAAAGGQAGRSTLVRSVRTLLPAVRALAAGSAAAPAAGGAVLDTARTG